MEAAKLPVFERKNYLILGISLLVLSLGFALMALDTAPYGFGILGLTAGPALVFAGLLLPLFSLSTSAGNKTSTTQANQFARLDMLAGWFMFALALAVYVRTLEPTTSFWDPGEFISAAYKLQVPHPPGAPLFLLTGRLFSFLALGDLSRVAYWINMVSALASAFTILFLFRTITLLTKKLLFPATAAATVPQQLLVLGSGVVGALSFTFSDSFWFSAVEAEVYASSSFFTALVVWAMLQWEQAAGTKQGYHWLILIAYLMGLSIGVHLLNLLAIPAMGLICFHRHFRFSYRGFCITLLLSLALIALIMWGIIPGLPALAGNFEIFFVNTFRLPFGSGIVVFLVLFVAAVLYLLRFTIRRRQALWQTLVLSFIYILLGYSSYLIIPIRSGYDPPIDENNPEGILRFVSYLRREQYEERPLLYGPQFSAELLGSKEGAPQYARGQDSYKIVDYKFIPEYDPAGMSLLPRLYSGTPLHLSEYRKWVDIREGQKPTMGQNLSYLLRYQLGHMYGRYFLWNFVGRSSDMQQAPVLWPWDQQKELPYEVATNKARNNYYLLPLLLGIAGCIYHFRKNRKDALAVLLLFFFTGLAIALYLNQPPIEPRERDYAFVGSYYAFAIWIGLGVPAVAALVGKFLKNGLARASVACLLCLSVPAVMAAQGWDDHDRSDRFYASDYAHNVLASCAPNAILFTNGDNDTFPLWYKQEVEGFRRDVRVIVLPYLNSDWYIAQMTRPAYESAPLPITLQKKDYAFSNNNILPLVERPQVASGIDVQQFISLVEQQHPALQVAAQGGKKYLSTPTKAFFLEVDKEAVRRSGIVPEGREQDVVDRMRWSISGTGLQKKQLVIFDILANNNWERPIYFSSPPNPEEVGNFDPYLQLEGMVYRLLPVRNPDSASEAFVAKDIMYRNMMQVFRFRNLTNPSIYYDNVYQTQVLPNMRRRFGLLAQAFVQDGEMAKAKEVLQYSLAVLPDASLPYDFSAPMYVELLAQVGEQVQADALFATLSERVAPALAYYTSLPHPALFDRQVQMNLMMLQNLYSVSQDMDKEQEAQKLEALFRFYMQKR